MTHKDGIWRALPPGHHTATVKVYANYTRKAAWHGRVSRFNLDTGQWEHDRCPHNHYKQGQAKQCAQRAAGRLNKEAKEQS